ncbi:hypothetical protein HMPREF1980_01423 [Actinomyces sp. oral taxon 172 str. F0311]|nr:hypothetical protein HMPREF1980_01423 [Actinomyces sp. oral taxon 172 str. F0311]
MSYRQHWGVHVVSFPTYPAARGTPSRARSRDARGRARHCVRGVARPRPRHWSG